MKKLLTLFLILALLLPAATALAEEETTEPEPIVGFWYTLISSEDLPEAAQKAMAANPFTSRRLFEVHVLRFSDDGTIYRVILEFEKKQVAGLNNYYGVSGTWFKMDNGNYRVTIVSAGSGEAIIKDGLLYTDTGNGVYVYRRMEGIPR